MTYLDEDDFVVFLWWWHIDWFLWCSVLWFWWWDMNVDVLMDHWLLWWCAILRGRCAIASAWCTWCIVAVTTTATYWWFWSGVGYCD